MRLLVSILTIAALAGCASQPARPAATPAPAARPTAENGAAQATGPEQLDPEIQRMIAALERVDEVRVAPEALALQVGDTAIVEVALLDSSGRGVAGAPYGFQAEDGISAERVGPGQVRVVGTSSASGTLTVVVPRPEFFVDENSSALDEYEVSFTVEYPTVSRIEIAEPDAVAYVGTTLPLHATAYSAGDLERPAEFAWRSSNPEIATVDEHGNLDARSPGTSTVIVEAGGQRAERRIEVRANPIASLDLVADRREVRVGDVVHLSVTPRADDGDAVEGARVVYSVAGPSSTRNEIRASIYDDGVFVAQDPGRYEVVARVGGIAESLTITARPRDVRQEVTAVGHIAVPHAPTSDVWAFEGLDGRDYAYTGTHSGGQKMFAFDITDPANPVLTDSVVVDARVVNDVKVSADARYAVMTREGASDRRNGIVLLDLSDPAHPTVISEYTETVTGGVHNVWIEWPYIYAIHNGTLDVHILDASDPENIREVGRWGIDKPGKYLHDINIWDGIGYASYWNDGVYILDFGGAGKGGTPTVPVVVSKFAYPEGNTHHTYRYENYLFTSDEIFGCDECWGGNPRGFIHVLDVSDLENPVEVARYEVPEAGNHNMWITDDGRLYTAYYNAGLRVVDVTGELRGDLYEQDREIGTYLTEGAEGEAYIPNAVMAWGAQPYKGNIIVSDLRSGLWILTLEPEED